MKILEPLFINVIRRLIENNVDFLLIGGYAVNYYGFGRYTGDIDFWLKPTNENKENFLKSLVVLEKNADDIKGIKELDFTQAQVISTGEEPLRIDFLTKVNLVDFDEAWQKRKHFPVENLQVPIVDYEHLILTKITTGRTKDKLDIEELQKINQGNKKE